VKSRIAVIYFNFIAICCIHRFEIPDCYVIDSTTGEKTIIHGTLCGNLDRNARRLIENEFEPLEPLDVLPPELKSDAGNMPRGPLAPSNVFLLMGMMYFVLKLMMVTMQYLIFRIGTVLHSTEHEETAKLFNIWDYKLVTS